MIRIIYNIFMDCSKYNIFFDGKLIDHKEFIIVLKSIQNSNILTDKGGFLFRSSMNENNFHIGIIPNFTNGERVHHYDIVLDYEDKYRLTGMFNVDNSLNILFTPPDDKNLITDGFKIKLKNCYKITSAIFIFSGIKSDKPLDWITKKILNEINMFTTVPNTLREIVELD